MTPRIQARLQSGGSMLCVLGAVILPHDLEAFGVDAHKVVELAERFGARLLGVYQDGAPEETSCSIFLAFANQAVFDQFRERLEGEAVARSWPFKIRILESLPGFVTPASLEPRIPYHLIRYH